MQEGFEWLRHIIVPFPGRRAAYRAPNSGGRDSPAPADRAGTGRRLRSQYDRAIEQGLEWLNRRDWKTLASGPAGVYIEIVTAMYDPDSFEQRRDGIEVIVARTEREDPWLTHVTLFIPKDHIGVLAARIDKYATEVTPAGNAPYRDFAEPILEVGYRDAIDLLWRDQAESIPLPGIEAWWEVWTRAEHSHHFISVIRTLGLRFNRSVLRFPDRDVRLVFATREQMNTAVLNSGSVAELRRPPGVPSVTLALDNTRQIALSNDLVARILPPEADAPAICILDSGINEGHPLLSFAVAHVGTFNTTWGTHDGEVHGHGTQIAGLALYGDLGRLLLDERIFQLSHVVESIKICPDDLNAAPNPEMYGFVFQSSMHAVEEASDRTRRVFCSATSNRITPEGGAPTQWSATIDKECADARNRRLFVLAAGNIDEGGQVIYVDDYITGNDASPILDPGQSWNALTVGAFTERTEITQVRYAGHVALATSGNLCPQSRTSCMWEPQWPVKPDVVFEGGNFAYAPGDKTAQAIDDLTLISTNADFRMSAFSSFGFTSGAVALAARMCAILMAEYPALRPETIRGLVVHSAEWTPEMLSVYDKDNENQRRLMLSRFGYGVPNLDRALSSLRSDFTMVVEGALQPFELEGSSGRNKEMLVYDLPWPKDELRNLGGAHVRLRVTLSYYIDPNPAERGYKGRYSYASHGLRFEVKNASESVSAFTERVNNLDRPDGYENPGGNDPWFLKNNTRDRGSIISDHWEGQAFDLANRGVIAIYPTTGWWKDGAGHRFTHNRAHFSLLMSLSVLDNIETDIYTPVAVQVAVQATVGIPVPSELAPDDNDPS